MAFLERLAPDGTPWSERLCHATPRVDEGGYLADIWGECLVAATRYEHEVPTCSSQPEYRRDGPAGQVISALCRSGHGRFQAAADRLECATHKALRRGEGTQPGPGRPEAWGLSVKDSSGSLNSCTRGNTGEVQESDSCSSSGSSIDSEVMAELASKLGLHGTLPWECYMGNASEDAPREVPPEILRSFPEDLQVIGTQRLSEGWHEVYLLTLSAPLCPGRQPKAILRIWRSQLSYWRLEVPTGWAVEMRAMELAREAGVPTASSKRPVGCRLGRAETGVEHEWYVGTCSRAPRGEACDWAICDFIEGGGNPPEPRHEHILRTMATLHSLGLSARNTTPISKFASWREHMEYLANLAAEAVCEDGPRAIQEVWRLFESSEIPDLPPALCHFDWHTGNMIHDVEGKLQAVIDWEFAGIADSRLDLARFCRHARWKGDLVCKEVGSREKELAMWSFYSEARFGRGHDVLLTLGPIEPWLALEAALVLVTGEAVCARARRRQQADVSVVVPRCGLEEWIEDMETCRWHLRRMDCL